MKRSSDSSETGRAVLDGPAIARALAALPGWRADGRAIARGYRFASFGDAVAFMGRAVPTIDAMDHHPLWSNTYDRVEVRLWTHDAGGVTALDVALAEALDALYAEGRA